METKFCSKCCQDFDIEPMHLLFPEMFLTEDAQYFMKAWNLERLTLEELRESIEVLTFNKVKVRVPCDKLTPEGLCSIYEQRPQLCREYRCETRHIMAKTDQCEPERRYIPLRAVTHA